MLPHADWLDRAKRLAVGMRVRVVHGRERRPNLVIGNDKDKWWAYCQACKEGGVLTKEHVLLNAPIVGTQVDLVLPDDIVPVLGSDYELAVGKFLAGKHMMYPYLPTLYYSTRTRRLMIQDAEQQWHGRDLTERSAAKWLHYGAKHSGVPAKTTILVEDMFSKWKVEYALRDTIYKHHAVVCTLGTSMSVSTVLALKDAGWLIWMYDGDQPGDDGYTHGRLRMQAFGMFQSRLRPPQGLDPKDMDCTEIRLMVAEAHKNA